MDENRVIGEDRVRSVRFDSRGRSYGKIPLDVFKGVSTCTIEISFSTTSTTGSSKFWENPSLIGNSTDGSKTYDFGICTRYGYLYLWVGMPSVETGWETSVLVNDGLIHHVSLVSNEDKSIDLYCDGVIALHVDDVGFTMSTSCPLYLGRNAPAGNNYADFDLHEVRLWNVALSSSQIFGLIDGTEEGLVAWYKCEYDHGTILDRMGNYPITLYGMSRFLDVYENERAWDINGDIAINGDRFTISSNAFLSDTINGGHDFTIETWAYSEGNTGDWPTVLSIFKEFTGASDRITIGGWYSTGKVCVFRNSRETRTSIDMGALRHYAIVYHHSARIARVYVDGRKIVEYYSVTFTGDYIVSFGLDADNRTTNFRGYFEKPRISDYAKWDMDFTPDEAVTTFTIDADTERNVESPFREFIIDADTERTVENPIVGRFAIDADSARNSVLDYAFDGDTEITIENDRFKVFIGDFDTKKFVSNNVISQFDTGRTVIYVDKKPFTLNCDSRVDVIAAIEDDYDSVKVTYQGRLAFVDDNDTILRCAAYETIDGDTNTKVIHKGSINADTKYMSKVGIAINADTDISKQNDRFSVASVNFDTYVDIYKAVTQEYGLALCKTVDLGASYKVECAINIVGTGYALISYGNELDDMTPFVEYTPRSITARYIVVKIAVKGSVSAATLQVIPVPQEITVSKEIPVNGTTVNYGAKFFKLPMIFPASNEYSVKISKVTDSDCFVELLNGTKSVAGNVSLLVKG